MYIDFIGGNHFTKMQDELLHAADFFDTSKRFAMYSRIKVDSCVDPATAINSLQKHIQNEGGFMLFAAVKTSLKTEFYLEQGISQISTISNGKHGWLMFHEMLSTLGYTPTMDNTMKVTGLE